MSSLFKKNKTKGRDVRVATAHYSNGILPQVKGHQNFGTLCKFLRISVKVGCFQITRSR